MNSKFMAIIVVAVLATACVGAYVLTDDDKETNRRTSGSEETIIDAVGRSVDIPDNLDNGIVTIGSTGPLRFVSMFGVVDNVIETDKGDVTDNRNGRAYSYAYPINDRGEDAYHPDNRLEASTVESIAAKDPSLVIVGGNVYSGYKENCDILAKKCTLAVMWNQEMAFMTDDSGNLADYFTNNVNMIGKLLGKESRATEIIDGVQDIIDDIASLKGTSDQKVYVAGVTISGSNTLNTTFTVYLPNILNGVKNAYTGSVTETKVVLNMDGSEFVNNTDIDIIVIDPSSSDKIGTQDSQLFLKYIYGINNDADAGNDIPMYVTVPIVWDSINYDCALASAYYIESIVYGTLTVEEAKEKIVDIFKTFYGDEAGSKVFDEMSAFFVKKSSDNNVELPLLSPVKVDKSGDTYRIVAA